MTNVAIVGSRDFVDPKNLIFSIVNGLADDESSCVLSGMATGADTLAEQAARTMQVEYHIWPAKWGAFGKTAGPRRNRYIANGADVMYAFYTDITNSRGTTHVTNLAKIKQIIVHEYDQKTDTWRNNRCKESVRPTRALCMLVVNHDGNHSIIETSGSPLVKASEDG